MKLNPLTKENIEGVNIQESDELSLDELLGDNLLPKLSINLNISVQQLFENIDDSDNNVEVLFNDVDDFKEKVIDDQFFDYQELYDTISFMNYDFHQNRAIIELQQGFDFNNIDDFLDVLNLQLKDRVDSILGPNNEKIIEKIKSDKMDDHLFDINNAIYLNVFKRMVIEHPKHTHLLNEHSQKPFSYNVFNTDGFKITNNEIRFRPRALTGSQSILDEINDELKQLLPHPYIENVTPTNSWKYRYRVDLTQEGLDYERSLMVDETEKYYKAHNLDPKTHLKKEAKKNLSNSKKLKN